MHGIKCLRGIQKKKKPSASRIFARTPSMIWRTVRITDSSKTVLIFLKIFLNFTIEKPGVINLSSKSYMSLLLLIISKSPFLVKWTIQPFIHYYLYIVVHDRRSMSSSLFCFFFLLKELFRQRLQIFCFSFFFFQNFSDSSSVKNSSLMFSWPLINASVGLSVISGGFLSRFLKCYFLFLNLFFFTRSF